MNDDFSNDNAMLSVREADPHGQAAILLVESLIHGLVEQNVISVTHAVEIVDTASEVKSETGPELGDSPVTLQRSLDILKAIAASLRHDVPTA